MNLVFFGTGAFGLPSLEALRESGHRILTVVTGSDKPQGRTLKPAPSPIKAWALAHDIPVLDFSKETPELIESLKKMDADAFIVISFGALLKEGLLSVPKLGAFNVHASLLPRYRGASPIRAAILNGDAKTGVTILRMTRRLDAGDVLVQKETPIDPRENATELEARLGNLGAEALLEALDTLKNRTAHFIPQNENEVTIAGKTAKEDGRIDWSHPTKRVLDRIRAMAGWPGAFSLYKGKRLKLLEAVISDLSSKQVKPGTVDVSPNRDVLRVRTGDGWVGLLRVQQESKRPLSAKDFLKGASLQSGEMLE